MANEAVFESLECLLAAALLSMESRLPWPVGGGLLHSPGTSWQMAWQWQWQTPLFLPPARYHSRSFPLSTKARSSSPHPSSSTNKETSKKAAWPYDILLQIDKQTRKGCSTRGGEQIPGRLRPPSEFRKPNQNLQQLSYQQFQRHHSVRNVLRVQGRNARRRQDQEPEALKYIRSVDSGNLFFLL